MAEITPVRKLSAKERKVFDRVASDFSHLGPTSSEMLCRFAECAVRYEDALKDVKKHPTVEQPIVNRSTGNITGYKIVRNPAFRTLAEAQSQMNALARRLLIDAASENRRLTLLSKNSRSLSADEESSRREREIRDSITEEKIEAAIARYRNSGLVPWWNSTYEAQREYVVYWMVMDALLEDGEEEENFQPNPAARDELTAYLAAQKYRDNGL
jgi:hypothetical protein